MTTTRSIGLLGLAFGTTFLVLLVACGGKLGQMATEGDAAISTSPPTTDADVPGSFDTDANAPDAAEVCNDAPLYGLSVDLIGMPGDPPTPTGGELHGSTYLLEAAEYYGPGAPTGRISTIGTLTLDIGGTTAALAVRNSVESRSTATMTMAGPTTLAFATTCSYPDGDAGVRLPTTAEYSTDGGLSLIIVPDGAPNARIVEHFGVFVNKK